MVRRLERKIIRFATRARSPRYRVAVLSLVGLIVLAQTGLVVHRIQHSTTTNDFSCTLCVAAHHITGPASSVQHYEPPSMPAQCEPFIAARPVLVHFETPYQTRAPPRRNNTV